MDVYIPDSRLETIYQRYLANDSVFVREDELDFLSIMSDVFVEYKLNKIK